LHVHANINPKKQPFWLSESFVMLDLLLKLVMLCAVVCLVMALYRQLFGEQFWQLTPWSVQIKIQNMTQAEASNLLYVIGQESSTAFNHMPVLCALCGVTFPPQPDRYQPGPRSVPSNVATPTKVS
jgi:hypothetical protein